MAKLYTAKTAFSIIFVTPHPGSNSRIHWDKVNFMFPPNTKPPTFESLHNSFLALDTIHFSYVLNEIDIQKYVTSKSSGTTDDYKTLEADIIYAIKVSSW